jgi:hypothetical protein
MATRRNKPDDADVRRVGRTSPALRKSVTARVRACSLERFEKRLAVRIRERELREEVLRPLFRVIESDPAAMTAVEGLRNLVRDHARAGETLQRFSHEWGGPSSFDLAPGNHVFNPPFDLQDAKADRWCSADAQLNGSLTVDAGSADARGARSAFASVSIVLQPAADGTLEVRPWINYTIRWTVGGTLLSAHSEGHVGTVAVDDNYHEIGRHDVTLWYCESEDSHGEDESYWVPPVGNTLQRFAVRAGHQYTVAVYALVWIDQSGPRYTGSSYATGRLVATVPLFGATLSR